MQSLDPYAAPDRRRVRPHDDDPPPAGATTRALWFALGHIKDSKEHDLAVRVEYFAIPGSSIRLRIKSMRGLYQHEPVGAATVEMLDTFSGDGWVGLFEIPEWARTLPSSATIMEHGNEQERDRLADTERTELLEQARRLLEE